MQPAQLGHRQHRLFDCGAADLVADDGRSGVAEQQVEHARLAVVRRAVTGRDGPADAGRDVGVEPHLAFVEAQRQTRLPARRIGGGDLEHHRIRAGGTVGIGQRDAVALAHLAGADALGAEPFDVPAPMAAVSQSAVRSSGRSILVTGTRALRVAGVRWRADDVERRIPVEEPDTA